MRHGRIWMLVPALAAFLLLCACARLYDGTYVSVTEREETELNTDSEGQFYLVHTYAGMRNALEALISDGAESGMIRVQNYDGSVADDIARICLDETKDSALGSYAVDYITHSVNRILSYDEVQLHIRYRRSKEELDAVVSTPSLADMYRLVDDALIDRSDRLSVQIATLAVTEKTLLNYVQSFYQQHPDQLSAQPAVSVAFYPDESSVNKVIAFSFNYRYTGEEEQARLAELNAAADQLTADLNELSAAEAALLCCNRIREVAVPRNGGNTAYDVLADGSGNSAGFAMAYQLLCSRCGIPCQVVEGRKGGEVHSWNIVKLGRSYYHVDCCSGATIDVPANFLLSDGALIGEYWWDVDRYPSCQGELRPEYVVELLVSRQGNWLSDPAASDLLPAR